MTASRCDSERSFQGQMHNMNNTVYLLKSVMMSVMQSLGLLFVDDNDERKFFDQYVQKSVVATQIFLALGALSFASYYKQDILINPNDYYIANMIRIFFAMPLMLLCSIAISFRWFKKRIEIIVVINAFVVNFAQAWIFSNLENGYNYAGVGFCTIFLALSIAFIVRITYLAVIAISALLFTIGGHLYANNADPGWLIVNMIGLLTALMLGMAGAIIRERAARSQFMANRALSKSRLRAEALLRSILPEKIADRMQAGEIDIADSLPEVSVVFADIAGFTSLSRRLSPTDLIRLLDGMFSSFDSAADRCAMEKITTIGDAYLAVGGMDGKSTREALAHNAAQLALAIRDHVTLLIAHTGYPINVRIGIHLGPLVAGVVGERRPTFDCWGEAIVVAQRLENQVQEGGILMSDTVVAALGASAIVGDARTISFDSAPLQVEARELLSLNRSGA